MVAQYTVFGRQVGSHVVSLHLTGHPLSAGLPAKDLLQLTILLQLAMITLGTTFAGSYLALRGGGEKKPKEQRPPINAQSKEEEDFIQYACTIRETVYYLWVLLLHLLTGVSSREFIRNANAEEQKTKQ